MTTLVVLVVVTVEGGEPPSESTTRGCESAATETSGESMKASRAAKAARVRMANAPAGETGQKHGVRWSGTQERTAKHPCTTLAPWEKTDASEGKTMRKRAKRWGATGAGGALLLALSTQAGTEPTALTGDALAALQAAAEQADERWQTNAEAVLVRELAETVLAVYGQGERALGLSRLQALAQGGNAPAQLWLGIALSAGVGETLDRARGQELIEQSAAQGYGRAQLAAAYGHKWLGWSADGEGGARAMRYTRAAAQGGEVQGQLQLGEALLLHPGANRATLAEALGWLSASAAQGCARGAWRAAQAMELLAAGENTEPVLHAYQEAARLGSAEAAFAVSTRLAATGTEDTARGWLKAAAQRGLASAQAQLAVELRMEGKAGEGARWAERAAHQGNARAQALLGELLASGHEVALDQASAYFWLLLARAGSETGGASEGRPGSLEWARAWLTAEEAQAVEAGAARWSPTAERRWVPCMRRRRHEVAKVDAPMGSGTQDRP